MEIEEAKRAIRNRSIVDYRYPEDEETKWRWMIPTCLSDDESTIYYKINGMGLFSLASSLKNIIVTRIE